MKKILLATMSLGIGGAETHIYELAKALKDRGYDITVVSFGGVYAEKLAEYGVKHVSLPLNSRNPKNMIKSYLMLNRLIKKEKFDIIHAHARIPAFLCGMIAKRRKIRFVTTAHGTFEVTPLLKKLSDWGEKTLSVSYDIKEYLISNYHIPSDNIIPTINGIDTGLFSDEADFGGIVKELSLSQSEHRIIYVSRIDEASAHIAFALTEGAYEIYDEFPDVQIVIVGAGDVFDKLKKEADEVNSRLGRNVVVLAGARTDVYLFDSWANLFVGVSRAALEAMSAGTLTILSGSQGSSGLFEESGLKEALDTNFTARGRNMFSKDELVAEIKKAYSLPEERRKELLEFGRKVVKEHYSIKRMADDTEELYKSITPYEPYRYGEYILNGYYGFGNTGDDSLLLSIIAQIKSMDQNAKITVMANNPKEISKICLTKCIHRYNIIKIAMEMRHAKYLIYGGGSLVQSVTSSRSLVYYTFILSMAKKFGLKTMLYANGIGPFANSTDEQKAKRALDRVDMITLRDKASLHTMNELGAANPNVYLTADAAFDSTIGHKGWCEHLMAKNGLDPEKGFFAVSLRTWKDLDENFETGIAHFCEKVKEEYGLAPVFIAMQMERDYDLCKRLSDQTGGILMSGLSHSEVKYVISKASFVCGMRLHLLIYAASCAVPVIGLSYDPKIDALFSELESDLIMSVNRIDVPLLCKMAEEAMASDREKTNEVAGQLISKAKLNLIKLQELVSEK